MKRILVAVDGSIDSYEAARVGAVLARATSARLELVFVVEPGPPRIPALHEGEPAIEREQRERAAQVFERIARETESKPLTRIERGGPADKLCELARDPEVTLVLAGSRGHHSILRGLIGSVSQRLAAGCPRPVLIARAAPFTGKTEGAQP